VALSSIATVALSTAVTNTVTLSSAPSFTFSSGTVTLSSAVQISSGTITLSSNPTVIPSSVWTVTLSSAPSFAISSAIQISSGTVTLSSNPTVIPSSAVQVTLTSNVVALSSIATVTPSSIANVLMSSAGLYSAQSVLASCGTNSTLFSSRPTTVFRVELYNNSTTIAYLKMYNMSSAPTAGSTTISLNLAYRIMIPGNSGGAGVVNSYEGMIFATGLGYTLTTGITSSDTGGVAANTYIVNIGAV
jgi:hypothetical protein